MASGHDPEASRRHRKQSSSGVPRKSHHKKTRSRSRAPTSSSEDASTRQGLSIDALAQLNAHNVQSQTADEPAEPKRKSKKSRPRREEYAPVDTDNPSPRRQRRSTHNYQEVDQELESPRRTRHRRNESQGYNSEATSYHDSPKKKKTRAYVEDSDQDAREAKRERRRQRQHAAAASRSPDPPRTYTRDARSQSKKSRNVSGAIMEEGRSWGFGKLRGGGGGSKDSSYDSIAREKGGGDEKKSWFAGKNKKKWIIGAVAVIILIIIIAVAASVSKNNSSGGSSGPDKSGLGDISESDIPPSAKGTYLDPFTWYDTTDFNVTYTNETVGDLPIMGLYTEWDDSTAANDDVPAINKNWGAYTSTPARGVNLGGWLSLEPFITPSLFDYDSILGIIDEYTLCSYLGPSSAAETLEKHYATFVTEQTFADIQAAGLDHVRIPYSYWAVQTYDDDPYVFRTSWRYLLRGIEWARKYGLRIKLDLHGVPGSQNGWNHSGRMGAIGWLNGTMSETNRQRSLDVHDRLSKFFAQDRYRDILAFYGVANEPRMVDLPANEVTAWTSEAFNTVRNNGITAAIVFGDGFMGLSNWQGRLQGHEDLVLDVHQYLIFNNGQITYTHQEKVKYACSGWTEQTESSMNRATGFGPTMFAEWSQADTDCVLHLTNVGWGNRWTGTYDSGNASTEALTPLCPTQDDTCSCDGANADPSSWSDTYKQFLKMFAEAQMHSFEKGWGWFYWTWDTESAHQWSYKKGLAAGILPSSPKNRDFDCDTTVPDFASMGLPETY